MYYFTSDFDLVLRDLDNGTVETLLESDEVVRFFTRELRIHIKLSFINLL